MGYQPPVRPTKPTPDVCVTDAVAVDGRHHVGVAVVVDVGDYRRLCVDYCDGWGVVVGVRHCHVCDRRPVEEVGRR